MTGMRAWFAGRSLRERRMILVMLALLAITLVWGGIILPVRDGLSSARERYGDAAVRFAATQDEIDLLRAAGRRVPLSGTLADTLRLRADAAGLTLASVDESGAGRVHATIQAAKPGALARWFGGLEASGILIESANWRDNQDGSVAVDFVVRARAA
ncbi:MULTISPECIES: type II secretion system protein GspM [Sphingomonas]|uniref:Type II secretion system protein GspM n=1 Tax=Sphingomonas kyungheensis TaxID=1069987 RepID=A0ABU8H1Z0_9SPHN|nr:MULTISPECIES: type II secretion system protein GspM [unclassified Sphingomonas]EZP51849.1 General secretion pathway, M family protein [Sphingomonas sp. RIT328]